MNKITFGRSVIIACVVMVSIVFGSYFIHIGNVKITSEDIKDTEMIDNADYIAPVSETEITDDGKININSAEKDILVTLDGIGDKMADRIIAYRTKQPFNTIEDLMKVSGIGQKKFDKIKDKICAE